MALYSVKTEGESQNIYSFFTENGFDYVKIHSVEDYEKNGLTGAYLEKLRRLAADNWDYSIDEDRNIKFTEAVFRAARVMDKEMTDLPDIEKAHPLLQRLYFLALNDNDSHEAIVDPMAISDYEIDFKMSWDMLLDGIKKDIAAFGLKDDIDTCNDEFELVVKSSVLPKFKVKYRGVKDLKIYMNVGADKYMALGEAGAFKVVSKDHALTFQHAYDMCLFINKNRKRINAFLRENSLNLVLKTEMNTEDEETGRVQLEENAKGFCFETVDRGNECSVKTDMALAS